MSCTSPLTVASTIVPLPSSSVFSMCGSSQATAVFMTSADCSTNGSCISPLPNSSPTTFMPPSRLSLTMSRAVLPVSSASWRSASSPLRSPSMMRRASRSPSGSAASSSARLWRAAAGSTPSNRSRKRDSGSYAGSVSVAGAPTVIDHVERDLALLLVDLGHRQDLGGVHDGRVETGLRALVQEHAVEHHAGGGIEPERHVGQTQRRLHGGMELLDLADRLDGLEPVAPRLLLAGGDREGQRVDDDVLDLHAPVGGEVLDQPGGDAHLPLGRSRLAFLVDAQRDNCRAVLADHGHHPSEARLRTVAVLVVHRVDDGASAEGLEAGLDHCRLRGVEHERQRRRGGEAAGDLAHVVHAVTADVVDADIEKV